MQSILSEFEKRVGEYSNKLLYVFLDIKGNIKTSYTYREFDLRTNSIASYIANNYHLKPGDRVLLAYPAGLEMICAFFACVKLGLIPVPVYPPSAQGFESSIKKMNFIAQDCEAKAILTERSYYWSIKVNLERNNSNESVASMNWIVSDDSMPSGMVSFEPAHSDILFLQYTSGSTNDPKGVIVTHDNLLNNCDNVVDHLPIGVSWLPQYHDMGLIGYYIFFALKGGTTYGFSPSDFILKPSLWLETITKYAATASSAPNFAYEYCLAPGKISEEILQTINLSSLRFLMIAAEPINIEVYQNFLSKFQPLGLKAKSFFAAYGLAEFTLAVSNYGRNFHSFDTNLLKKNEAKVIEKGAPDLNSTGLMSCGKPLGNTQVKIVDPNSKLPTSLKQGQIGEIWIGGKSKCAGYWNRPELSEKYFEAVLDEQHDQKWLRSGDLGFLYQDELYVCGRLKDMIIIRGQNYYPQDVELLIEQDPKVRKGCVAAFSIESHQHELLAVVIGLKNNKQIPEAHDINSKLNNYLGIVADVLVYIPARTISKTSSGKIMRYLNKDRYLKGELQVLEEVNLTEVTNHSNLPQNVLNEVNSHHCKLLFQKYKIRGSENETLTEAGFDSLKMAEFAQELKVLLTDLGFEDLSNEMDLRLLQRITISELFNIVGGLNQSNTISRYRYKQAFSRLNQEFNQIEWEMMKRDRLGFSKYELQVPSNVPDTSSGYILLIGGTGFFGPFLLKSLIEQNKEFIYVLVRAENEIEGLKRLKKAFEFTNSPNEILNQFDARVRVVCGDLSKANLGLKDEDWEFLSRNIHTIYSNGALVNYLFDYESMRAVNVGGTNELLRFTTEGRNKILNHISTTFIFGWSTKPTLLETDSNDSMELLDFGYSQSKWVSEQLVKDARAKGLNIRIFRPALISPSIDGDGSNFDISIRLLAFMIKYGIGTSAMNQVSFTPADMAANNIIAISNLKESMGKTFHVTRDEFSSMEEITTILARFHGQSFINYTLKEFVPEVVGRCKKEDILFPLLNFLVRSVDNISAMEFKRYDNSNYRKYRDLSTWGKKDQSLEQVVKGIYLFMKKNDLFK